jgi:hypothetical protein
MAEIRCPMCSKSNPDDVEVCNFCGARMKPLIVDPTSHEAPTDWGDDLRSEQDEGSDESEDWLARVREDVDRMEHAPAEEPKIAAEPADDPDWLGRLRHVEVDRDLGAPVGEIPDWLEEASEDQVEEEVVEEEPEQEIPDWLARIRDRESDEGVDTFEPPLEPDEDLLERIREDDEPVPSEEVKAPVDLEADDRIEPALDFEPPEISSTIEAPIEHVEEIEPGLDGDDQLEPALDFEPPEISPTIDVPFESVEEIEPDMDAILSEAAALERDWFIEDEAGLPKTEEPAVPFAAEIVEEEPPADVEPAPAPIDALPVEEPEPSEPSDEIPSWAPPDYEESRPKEMDAEEVPEWLKDTGPLVESDLPRMPALVLDEDDEPSETEEEVGKPVDLDLDAIELPDWLTDLRETKAREEIEQEGPSDELAPASLPNWLEAMRPIETFRSIVEIESEEDKAVESAGPLAGLRGVLAAEPVMAMPRAAGVGSARLEVTERQYAQTEILQRIVQEDEGERPAQARTRIRRPIARWLVTLVLVFAVALPSLMPGSLSGAFPLPSLVPRDLGPLFSMVERLPTEDPVLVVFDYTPGYYGELEAVAGVFLEHVISRELFIATVSTSPTGPPLAEEMLSRFGENGADYINLGYLSGGPTAVQLFAAAPREAVREGFNLPDELAGTSGWHSPYLAGAARLDDFGMVAVITAGTESARTWAEQAYPWKGETPLIMVLSTGAEPFVRPYYEALNPQVDGILTGLPSAVAYEQQIGRVSTARSRWDAFGLGTMAAEFVLIAGGLYGAVLWWLRFRRVQG